MEICPEIRKNILKSKAVKFLFYWSGLYLLIKRLADKNGIYIVFYHRLVEKQHEETITLWSVECLEFEKQVGFFKKEFEIITMDEAINLLTANCQIRKKYLVITFDDGYMDNYLLGYELFKKYDLKPIIFLAANNIENQSFLWPDLIRNIVFKSNKKNIVLNVSDLSSNHVIKTQEDKYRLTDYIIRLSKTLDEKRKYQLISSLFEKLEIRKLDACNLMLSWEEINKLSEIGTDFGGHTMNHPILSNLPPEEVVNEIYASKVLIEKRLEKPINNFAYPNGGKKDFNGFVKNVVAKYYKTAVTTIPGINAEGCDLLELKRIGISYDMSILDLKIKILGIQIKSRVEDIRRLLKVGENT